VLADILLCTKCGHREQIEDWSAPILPISAHSCCNCGSQRLEDPCNYCSLSAADDKAVHLELRDLIAPGQDFLTTARQANKMGRRLIALKLATAAVIFGADQRVEAARALRVWLLSAVGEKQAAYNDAKNWVQQSEQPSQLAWGSLGQQCENLEQIGEASEAYRKALEADPGQHLIRCRRAKLLIEQSREGQAIHEITYVCQHTREDKFMTAVLPVAALILDTLETRDNHDECARLLGLIGNHVTRSPHVLAHAARINALAGKSKEAQKQLKKARTIESNLPIYARVEAVLKPSSQSSWRKW